MNTNVHYYLRAFMRKTLLFTITIILIIATIGEIPVQAAVVQPAVMQVNGDLYLWDTQTTTQLTHNGLNGDLTLSPDGQYVAFFAFPDRRYLTCAAISQSACQNPPYEVWLLTLASRKFTQITQAPRRRNSLTWAPDSKRLAWWDSTDSIAIYDLATQAITHPIQNLPGPFGDAGFLGIALVTWGADGLVVTVNSGGIEHVLAYSPAGVKKAEWQPESDLGTVTPAVYQGHPVLIGLGYGGSVTLLDIAHGELTDLGHPTVQLSTNPTQLALIGFDFSLSEGDNGTRYTFKRGDLKLSVGYLEAVAFSSSGTRVLTDTGTGDAIQMTCWCDTLDSPLTVIAMPQDTSENAWTPDFVWAPLYVWIS
jgi:WD40 repeat protein